MSSSFDEKTLSLESLRDLLVRQGIDFQFVDTDVNVIRADDAANAGVCEQNECVPTLILKSEKGLIAALVPGDRRISTKVIKKHLGLRNVAFASPEQVREADLGQIGSISMVNPGIQTILDAEVMQLKRVWGGSGVPNVTLVLCPMDLARVTRAEIFPFSEPKSA